MHRREFLVRMGGVLVAVPFVLEAVGCGDDAGGKFAVTSTTDTTGHTHSITVLCADLTANGVTYTSSRTDHTHTVTLGLTQLQMIAGGGSVDVTSSTDSSHSHQWSIRKPAGTC